MRTQAGLYWDNRLPEGWSRDNRFWLHADGEEFLSIIPWKYCIGFYRLVFELNSYEEDTIGEYFDGNFPP